MQLSKSKDWGASNLPSASQFITNGIAATGFHYLRLRPMKFPAQCVCLFTGLMISSSLQAQNALPAYSIGDRFISSAGASWSQLTANHRTESLYGVCYSPSLNLLNKFSDFSFGAASHLSASWHPASETDSSSYLAFSIPMYARFSFGHLATHDFFSNLGFFFGAGYHFSFVDADPDRGALLITGLRFWISKLSFTAGYAHFRLSGQHELLHQVSLQLNLGAYLRDSHKNNKLSKFVKPFRK